MLVCLFFFNDTATTEIYTLSLHDALPICPAVRPGTGTSAPPFGTRLAVDAHVGPDRKSTRLNSSHVEISYAVFCLKKKKKAININNKTDRSKGEKSTDVRRPSSATALTRV